MKGFLIILIFAGLFLQACSVKLVKPECNNSFGSLKVAYLDTLIFRIPNKNRIDSVMESNNESIRFRVTSEANTVKIVLDTFVLGNHTLDYFVILQNGKRKRLKQSLFIVSSIDPEIIIPNNYEVIPHDTSAYTQGLLFHNNQLFESTGLVGKSKINVLNPLTGERLHSVAIDSSFFGEGMTSFDNQLWQLTWKDGILQIFSHELCLVNKKSYPFEGWGLTNNETYLIASDGTNVLRFINTDDLSVMKSIHVFDDQGSGPFLNELEWVNGQIWANVYGKDMVIVVDPDTGLVHYHIDLAKCIDRQLYPFAGVCNGIAFDEDRQLVYFTGKNWPCIIRWKLEKVRSSDIKK